MKNRLISVILAVCTAAAGLLFSGCSEKAEEILYVIHSENYAFAEDMTRYMLSYTAASMADEIKAGGGDITKPLSEQTAADGRSWAEHIVERTLDSMRQMLIYSEAALRSDFAVTEGMVYRANETVRYLSTLAEEYDMTGEEYLEYAFGEGVTERAYRTCVEMMTLCEAFDLDLFRSHTVTEEEVLSFAEENPAELLEFDCLRYSLKDGDAAERLAAAADGAEFGAVLKNIPGTDITDKDKNGIPDVAEHPDSVVASSPAGDFAWEEGRQPYDTCIEEKDGVYTVTMILTVPEMSETLLWDYRMVQLSEASSTDPIADCTSLVAQIREKGTGEEGFSNIAYRYSENSYAYYGGLYNGVDRDGMPCSAAEEWLTDPARREGDMTAVEGADGVAYMLYFLDGPVERWKYSAEVKLRDEAGKEKMEKLEADGTVGEPVLDEELLSAIAEDVFS